ncbi:winged helix-turn-helix domain-containing protein [Streptomyces adustus]|uniref:winged helix-turn-helix domain-containing protein n=1 Tax=Streptomyces adustus TaxID=1609272 RepID=UPI00371282C3
MKTLIGRLFHVSYTVEGTWRLLKRHGWSWQQPTWRAIERDDAAVEVWKKETWPRVRASRRSTGPGWSSRTKPGSRLRRVRGRGAVASGLYTGCEGAWSRLRPGVGGRHDLLQTRTAVPAVLRGPGVHRTQGPAERLRPARLPGPDCLRARAVADVHSPCRV